MKRFGTWFDSPMKRLARRFWLGVAYLSLAGLLLLGWNGVVTSDTLVLVAAFAVMTIFVRLNRATSTIVDKSSSVLDERQEGMRNRAYRVSYQIMTGLALLLGLAFVLARSSFTPYPSFFAVSNPEAAARAALGIYFVLLFILPTTIVAWLEPDPIDDLPQGEMI